MRRSGKRVSRTDEAVSTPIWQEVLVGVEYAFLKISPVYWGFGVPPGDGSAVVLIPGLLCVDLHLAELGSWLARMGYRPYSSGIGWNAECPNLLIRQRLVETIHTAQRQTKRRVHLIGHSLGGVLARAAASQMPDAVASVTTLGAPFRGVAAHPSILRLTEWVREKIHARHGEGVLPHCYTGACTCEFLQAILGEIPPCVHQTAIYTKADGIVDWRVCCTGDPTIDVEVTTTHLGLTLSPVVYDIIGRRIATVSEALPSSPPALRSIQM
jgi:hypothetical protein